MVVLNERLIRSKMNKFAKECRDASTGEVDHTLLAEAVANDLDLYDDDDDFAVPDRVMQIAKEFN